MAGLRSLRFPSPALGDPLQFDRRSRANHACDQGVAQIALGQLISSEVSSRKQLQSLDEQLLRGAITVIAQLHARVVGSADADAIAPFVFYEVAVKQIIIQHT